MAMFRAPKDLYNRPPKEQEREDKVSRGVHQCDICSKGWDSDTEVNIHRTTAHKKYLLEILQDEKLHACKICIKPHKSREELIQHMKYWHLLSSENAVRVEREVFICDKCSTLFFNKDLIRAHMVLFHTASDKLSTYLDCPKCAKKCRLTNSWFHFQRHQMMSLSCCKICFTKFADTFEVMNHVRQEHSKHLFCDICQYEGKNENYFKEHLAVRHRNESKTSVTNIRYKPYFLPCYGDKKFKIIPDTAFKGLRLSSLDYLEMRICVLCREICIGDKDMKCHIQSAHMPMDPQSLHHICSCGQSFNNKVLLKHHVFKSGGDHKYIGTTNSDENVEVYAIVLVPEEEYSNETTAVSGNM